MRTEPGHRDNYFKPDQRGWYEPCERDVNGQPIDEVVDWVAMEYKLLRQEKVVATMMVLLRRVHQIRQTLAGLLAGGGSLDAGDSTQAIRRSQSRGKSGLPTT